MRHWENNFEPLISSHSIENKKGRKNVFLVAVLVKYINLVKIIIFDPTPLTPQFSSSLVFLQKILFTSNTLCRNCFVDMAELIDDDNASRAL